MTEEKYYIDGKQYSPNKSLLLCSYKKIKDWLIVCKSENLYRTQKGAYFKVTEIDGEKSVSILSEDQALEFLREHPEGIETNAYDQIFGEPEEG